jgi:hypothetical protein
MDWPASAASVYAMIPFRKLYDAVVPQSSGMGAKQHHCGLGNIRHV